MALSFKTIILAILVPGGVSYTLCTHTPGAACRPSDATVERESMRSQFPQ